MDLCILLLFPGKHLHKASTTVQPMLYRTKISRSWIEPTKWIKRNYFYMYELGWKIIFCLLIKIEKMWINVSILMNHRHHISCSVFLTKDTNFVKYYSYICLHFLALKYQRILCPIITCVFGELFFMNIGLWTLNHLLDRHPVPKSYI